MYFSLDQHSLLYQKMLYTSHLLFLLYSNLFQSSYRSPAVTEVIVLLEIRKFCENYELSLAFLVHMHTTVQYVHNQYRHALVVPCINVLNATCCVVYTALIIQVSLIQRQFVYVYVFVAGTIGAVLIREVVVLYTSPRSWDSRHCTHQRGFTYCNKIL